MVRIGYALSSEEHTAPDLINLAKQAEYSGFQFAFISDHFHPWTDQQGESSFVWSVLGAIAQTTSKMQIATGVTAPIIRYHPTLVAQAAATAASLMENRFMLGVGTGENLNEHITGAGWPPIELRQSMLREAVEIIRQLWTGDRITYYGTHYTVEDARIYSLPKFLPPILVAASGPHSARLAGEIGDGLVTTSADNKVLESFNKYGGNGKARFGQIAVCYATTKKEAVATALKWWPNAALKGQLGQELRIPAYFESAVSLVTEEDIAKVIVASNQPDDHLAAIQKYIDAGIDNVYVHQVGPKQEAFFEFYQREILPRFT